MEFFRRAFNPWNQEVLLGISWDVMWAVIVLSGAFVVAHLVWVKVKGISQSDKSAVDESAGLSEKILRHALSARVFHWAMSIWMFALLVTAFLPVMGIQFAWVTLHWIAGVLLTITIIYHMVNATFFQDFRSMLVEKSDIRDGVLEVKKILGKSNEESAKAGKYPIEHKMYHHIISVVSLAAIVTGVLMMFRVDNWLWAKNPYLLGDRLWGWVYVVHGLAGVSLIGLVVAHIYFAVRPEKRWITWSMIHGWISRGRFTEHHDPKRWNVDQGAGSVSGGTAPMAEPQREQTDI